MGKWGERQTFFGKFHRRRRRKEQKWERDHLHFSPGNSIPFPLRQKKSEEAEWQLSFSFFSFPPRKEKEKGLELYSLNEKERRCVEKRQKRINELFFHRRQKKKRKRKRDSWHFFPCINPLDTPGPKNGKEKEGKRWQGQMAKPDVI